MSSVLKRPHILMMNMSTVLKVAQKLYTRFDKCLGISLSKSFPINRRYLDGVAHSKQALCKAVQTFCLKETLNLTQKASLPTQLVFSCDQARLDL